jgi:hypothetical protein
MRREHLFSIIAFGILCLLLIALAIPLETSEQDISISLNVTNPSYHKIEFTVAHESSTELNFGTTFPGTTVIKIINLTRGLEPPAYVSISSEGQIQPWLTISTHEFLLNTLKQVTVSVNVPQDAHAGTYSGCLVIVYKKTLLSILQS